jgi:hypothetical protein
VRPSVYYRRPKRRWRMEPEHDKLYDRIKERLPQDEVERIRL